MDRIGLQTLREELLADAREAERALAEAKTRLEISAPAGLEAAAFQLLRLYNIVEQSGLRVAKAFENHIDSDSGWHSELARRLTLEIAGVRPAFWPPSFGDPLRQLRGFRHVLTHAYDLRIDADRLALLVRDAEAVVPKLRPAVDRFVKEAEGLLSA
ncbi:MAG: hypothetical protein ACREFX_13805 [Opitutaceae bacterium]